MTVQKMPRVQAIVLPILRAARPDADITSWYKSVDVRTWPFVTVRRLGGLPTDVRLLDKPVIELTSYVRTGIVDAEELYLDLRTALWDAWDQQTVVPGAGSISSYFETMGPTQFESPFEDSWRIQGLIQLGIRPIRQ